jgi:hypothetical protein
MATTADEVSTSAVSGSANVEDALGSLSEQIGNKIKRKTITVSCEASTWQYIPLSTLSQYNISQTNIINIIPTYGQNKWIIWRIASSNVIFLRLTTNSTNINIDETAGDFSLDIVYTDNIAST